MCIVRISFLARHPGDRPRKLPLADAANHSAASWIPALSPHPPLGFHPSSLYFVSRLRETKTLFSITRSPPGFVRPVFSQTNCNLSLLLSPIRAAVSNELHEMHASRASSLLAVAALLFRNTLCAEPAIRRAGKVPSSIYGG